MLLLLLSVIWGSSFIIIKKSLLYFSFVQIGSLRIMFASLALAPTGLKMVRRLPKNKIFTLVMIGLLGNVFPAFLFPIAQAQGVSSSIAGILNAVTPIFALIFGIAFFSTQFITKQLIGLLIAFLGCFGLILLNHEGTFGQPNFHILWIILSTVLYAINANIIKEAGHHLKPMEIAAFSLLLMAPIAIVMVLFSDAYSILMTDSSSWKVMPLLAILGMIGTAAALVIFNYLVQISSAVFATSTTYIIPIVAIFWGVWDGEKIHLLQYATMSLILIGVYLTKKFR